MTTWNKLGIVAGALAAAIAVGSAGLAGTVWALDTRYITIGGFKQALDEKELRDINRMIRKLEYLKNNNQITDQQRWELEGLYLERQELTQ